MWIWGALIIVGLYAFLKVYQFKTRRDISDATRLANYRARRDTTEANERAKRRYYEDE